MRRMSGIEEGEEGLPRKIEVSNLDILSRTVHVMDHLCASVCTQAHLTNNHDTVPTWNSKLYPHNKFEGWRKRKREERRRTNKAVRDRCEQNNIEWHERHARMVLINPIHPIHEQVSNIPVAGNHYGLTVTEAALLGKCLIQKKKLI